MQKNKIHVQNLWAAKHKCY